MGGMMHHHPQQPLAAPPPGPMSAMASMPPMSSKPNNKGGGPQSNTNVAPGGSHGAHGNGFVAAVLEELLARPQGTWVYRVQFKRAYGHFVPAPGARYDSYPGSHGASNGAAVPPTVGESVLVRVDRGEDVGIVMDKFPLAEFVERSAELSSGSPGQPCLPGVGTLLRHATEAERIALVEKSRDELEVLAVCLAQMRQRRLPMRIVDAEWRFDRQKLTVFYQADRYIDFRGLVRDLFSVYRTRIWMEKLGSLTV
jgi:hypothetical protein